VPRKRRATHVAVGAPEWMTTYGDMVTLLLCFFILLFSFSVIDAIRFQQILSSIQVAFLGDRGIMQTSPEVSQGEMIELSVDHKFEDVLITYQVIQGYLDEEGLEGSIALRLEERGVVLEIQDQILFDSGEAELRPGAESLLSKVASLLARLPNKVVVEGHTDNIPINTVIFPSNWELSVARSVRVVRFLSEQRGLAPRRFTAIGFGEYQPIVSNQTSEGRARNRRVNIVVSTAALVVGEEKPRE